MTQGLILLLLSGKPCNCQGGEFSRIKSRPPHVSATETQPILAESILAATTQVLKVQINGVLQGKRRSWQAGCQQQLISADLQVMVSSYQAPD